MKARRRSASRKSWLVSRIGRVVLEARIHGVDDAARQFAVAQSRSARRIARSHARPVQRRAQQGDLREVVEVARLQGGVLAVVGEAQKLARFRGEVAAALQLDERAHREDRGGGAPVVHAEGRQLEALRSLAPRVGDPARGLQAEQEIAVDQGGGRSLALRDDASGGVYEDRLRNVLAGGGPNPLHALGGRLLERFRQAGEQRGTGGAGPRRLFGEVQVGVVAAAAVGLAAVFAGQQRRPPVRPRREPHPVVGGPAMTAEDQREKRLVRLARFGRLLGNLQMAVRLGFQRRPHRVAACQELVQPEGEEGEAAGFVPVEIGPPEQPAAQDFGAALRLDACEFRELRCGGRLAAPVRLVMAAPDGRAVPCEPAGRLPKERTGVRLLAHAEGRFDPGSEGMRPERVVVGGRFFVRCDRLSKGAPDRRVRGVDLRRRTLQRLAYDLPGREVHPEQGLRYARHLAALLRAAPAAGHRGRGADAEGAVAEGVAAAADEHRDVRALAAPVGMQLVEDEEPETLCGPHQRAVLAAREQQLQHHVVRQKDIRRIAANRLAFVAPFLPRVARETHRRPAFRITPAEKLPELFVLAVGEGVHGVDDDGPDAPAGPGTKHVVHDRHDVGEALAGAGSGGQDAGPALGRHADRVALVSVQEEPPAAGVRVGLADPENARAFLVQHPFRDQIVDRATRAERRVQLEQRLRPEPLGVEDAVDEPADARVTDLDEAAGVVPVVGDQAAPQIKDVHGKPSCHNRSP